MHSIHPLPQQPMQDKRKARESQFHDEAFRNDDSRRQESKFYAVVKASWKGYETVLAADCQGRTVLEYGCGPGSYAFFLGQRGGSVTGIDLSQMAIERARKRLLSQAGAPQFCVMDAERLGFKDASFDMICGRAILHHLDLAASLPEITRVLRPGGRAVFLEPLGHNPAINWYRNRTPGARTVDEHPLLMHEIKAIQGCFAESRLVYFHCLSLMTVPFRKLPAYKLLLRFFDVLDQVMFTVIPPTRRLAWTVMLELSRPNETAVAGCR
jgi:SAM-dependent methyltransferase